MSFWERKEWAVVAAVVMRLMSSCWLNCFGWDFFLGLGLGLVVEVTAALEPLLVPPPPSSLTPAAPAAIYLSLCWTGNIFERKRHPFRCRLNLKEKRHPSYTRTVLVPLQMRLVAHPPNFYFYFLFFTF